MREALQRTWVKWGTGAIFGVIILAFIFLFGPQTQGYAPGSTFWMAKVHGRQIRSNQVDATFERFRRFSNRRRMDEGQFLALKRQMAISAALVPLLAKRATDAGLAVSEQEARCYIVNWHRGYLVDGEAICTRFPAAWQTRYQNFDSRFYAEADGSFSQSYPRDVRSNFAMAIGEYEEYKRQELLALHYLDLLAASVPVPPAQVQSTWERRNTSVDLEFIALDPEDVGALEPTADEIAAWLLDNETRVADAYAADTARFETPRRVRVRRVYLRKPTDDDAPEYAEASRRYQATLERAQGGEDFEALARELTELEREGEDGGDMGLRGEDTLASDLWEATLGMAVGDIAGVEQSFAFNVIKLEELDEARVRSLDEVRSELAAELLRAERAEEARAVLADRGARVLEIAGAEGLSLEEAAANEAAERTEQRRAELEAATPDGTPAEEITDVAPLRTETTGAFARERPAPSLSDLGPEYANLRLPPEPAERVPMIGLSRDLMRIAFSLQADAPLHPEPIEVDGVPYLIRLAERTDAPESIPAAEYAQLYGELQAELSEAVVGAQTARVMLLLNQPGEYVGLVRAVIEESIQNGDLVIREDRFQPEDPVEEI